MIQRAMALRFTGPPAKRLMVCTPNPSTPPRPLAALLSQGNILDVISFPTRRPSTSVPGRRNVICPLGSAPGCPDGGSALSRTPYRVAVVERQCAARLGIQDADEGVIEGIRSFRAVADGRHAEATQRGHPTHHM